MRKAFVAMVAAAATAAAVFSAPEPAQAGNEGAVAAGIVGGLAAGAIIGSAVASRPVYAYPAYRPVPGYVVYAGYGAPYPVACPGGYWARRPIVDPYGNMVGYSRPRFFCPPA